MSSPVSYRLDQGTATIAMDDGKVNALSPIMLAELRAAFDRAAAEKAAVMLTGRPGVFSGGFDLKVLSAGGAPAYDLVRAGFELAERMLSFPAPIVVACTGHALAMGLFLVLSGDYRVGATGPYKLCANEVAIGLAMPRAPIEICRMRLAPAHLQRVLLNAEVYTPEDAVPAGLLDRAVPASDVEAAARAEMARLLTLKMPAFVETKLRLREATLRGLRSAIENDAALGKPER
jgi:enoyl-CoA hydratase